MNAAERGELYEESENEECFTRTEDVLDEEEDGRKGSLFHVVRRLMLITPKKSEDTQRHNIFRTRCRINENIISRDIVSQLKLAPRKHPTPFKIGWIKVIGEVRVTKQCEVLISMGKYKDTILFDILDMDACHVLLGRPWQFILETFLAEVRHAQTIFTIDLEENDTIIKNVQPNLHALLSEFKNIMLEELRMGMVEELLKKDVTQESKSPCAVPALLIPNKDKTRYMCIDSRAINKITFKYRFPIPCLDDM
ncbi:hypothetical protein Tco_0312900 [Tanacetum coccineum]